MIGYFIVMYLLIGFAIAHKMINHGINVTPDKYDALINDVKDGINVNENVAEYIALATLYTIMGLLWPALVAICVVDVCRRLKK